MTEKQKQYYLKNKEKFLISAKKSHEKNREKRIMNMAKDYKINKDYYKNYEKNRYSKHKLKFQLYRLFVVEFNKDI